jgi:ribosome biogenesis GTPase / thiamine phosphate phosphatase
MTTRLENLGYGKFFAESFAAARVEESVPARIVIRHKTEYTVTTEAGDFRAAIAGKLRFQTERLANLPAVGDWVVFRPNAGEPSGTILAVLPRKSTFSRKVAGQEDAEQVVAANIDFVFLVSSLDQNFSLRRIERYLVLAAMSGSLPVIVLNKADLCASLEETLVEVQRIAGSIPIHITNAKRNEGIQDLLRYLGPGISGAVLGPSGVGKSTIINRLLGQEKLKTQDVRNYDGKGVHTTSHRELVVLPTGGLLIDTPGMRELQLWEGEDGVEETFDDIERIATGCKFRNCRHQGEPGCAVQQALDDGRLDAARLRNYQKLLREADYQSRQYDSRAREEHKRKVKKITSAQKRGYKKP